MVTVLWIEDERYNNQALEKMLNRRGINLIKAGSKREAIDKLSLKFDLILLDIILPEDTGRDTLKDTKEPSDDLVGLSILRMLTREKYSGPIFVYTIINDLEVRNEIESYGVHYYKGNTKLKDLCDDIVMAIMDNE